MIRAPREPRAIASHEATTVSVPRRYSSSSVIDPLGRAGDPSVTSTLRGGERRPSSRKTEPRGDYPRDVHPSVARSTVHHKLIRTAGAVAAGLAAAALLAGPASAQP